MYCTVWIPPHSISWCVRILCGGFRIVRASFRPLNRICIRTIVDVVRIETVFVGTYWMWCTECITGCVCVCVLVVVVSLGTCSFADVCCLGVHLQNYYMFGAHAIKRTRIATYIRTQIAWVILCNCTDNILILILQRQKLYVLCEQEPCYMCTMPQRSNYDDDGDDDDLLSIW